MSSRIVHHRSQTITSSKASPVDRELLLKQCTPNRKKDRQILLGSQLPWTKASRGHFRSSITRETGSPQEVRQYHPRRVWSPVGLGRRQEWRFEVTTNKSQRSYFWEQNRDKLSRPLRFGHTAGKYEHYARYMLLSCR